MEGGQIQTGVSPRENWAEETTGKELRQEVKPVLVAHAIINKAKRIRQEDREFKASLGCTFSSAPVTHAWNPTQKAEIRRITVQSQPRENSW
jgi:hypothetical protein